MSEEIQVLVDGAVQTVVIDRAQRKNALTLAMYDDLTASLQQAAESEEVRVVLITGAGGVFTAGNDLLDFQNNPPSDENSPVFRFLVTLFEFAKPIIAAVDGPAVGIGTTMLLHCDLVYASDRATFSMPFTKLGLVPEAASSLLLPRIMGHQRAAELLMFGDTFDVDHALSVGIINRKVAAEKLLPFALEQAAELASRPPTALMQTKALMRSDIGPRIDETAKAEAKLFVERLRSAEAQKAFMDFFAKRR
jgi:enoyl-CoA hydratase/carnithine racemase